MTNPVGIAPRVNELLLYQTEDGKTLIEARFEGETVWTTTSIDDPTDPTTDDPGGASSSQRSTMPSPPW